MNDDFRRTGKKPILCVDFDGVLHSYTSGWHGVSVIADPPTPGAMQFIADAVEHFEVNVYSSRSATMAGRDVMRRWLYLHMEASLCSAVEADRIMLQIQWPDHKPSAFLTLDDRAVTFNGTFPGIADMLRFKPWNKRDKLPAPPVTDVTTTVKMTTHRTFTDVWGKLHLRGR